MSSLAASVRADYEARFGEPPAEPGGWYRRDDWPRVSYVAEMLRPGGDLLDVGVGAGQFLDMLARSGSFRSVVGVDKTRFKKYTELEPRMSTLHHVRRFEAADIRELFPDASCTLLDRPHMPWIIMEERFDGTSPDFARSSADPAPDTNDHPDARIARLRADVQALQSRRVVRAANLIGRTARRVRRRLRYR